MASETETLNTDPAGQAGATKVVPPDVREALLRLRKRGDNLPAVDAVEIIREGRRVEQRSDR